jgi:plastocyanin
MTAAAACTRTASPTPAGTGQSTAAAAIPANAASAADAASDQRAGRIVGAIAGPVTATTVVVLEPKTPRTFPASPDKPMMDQAQVMFLPELLLVRTGQPVEFHNSDDTLHNVHVTHEETRTPAFNVAIPTGGAYEYTFDRDGFYHVGCDIHTEMSASIFAWSSPYAQIAGADGSFLFADVPSGAWTVTVYAGARRLTQDVTVHGGVVNVAVQ